MTEYKLEPLVIELTAPKGRYEVTVTINAECDCIFSVFEEYIGYAVNGKEISNGTSMDIVFESKTDDGISIKIYCDGNISATAMASYIGD